MTNYDHTETFGAYAVLLRKSDPSPFLPESDEEGALSAERPALGARGGRGGAAAGDSAQPPAPSAQRSAPSVSIDFDGLQKRILPLPGVPARQYSNLKTGATGMIYFLEAGAGSGGRGAGG